MTACFNRRALFVGMLIPAIAFFAGTGETQTKDMRVDLTYAGGQAIPAGQIRIFTEDPAVPTQKQSDVEQISLKSDGKSYQIEFPLSWPTHSPASPTLRIVAQLEREDGWLLAHGSSKIEAGQPVSITLNKVMY